MSNGMLSPQLREQPQSQPDLSPSIGTLIDLGLAMSEASEVGDGHVIDAGYTYLGQFISHDMNRLDITDRPVMATKRRGTHASSFSSKVDLRLQSVYGEGFNDRRVPRDADTGHLKLSPVLNEAGIVDQQRCLDLPRNANQQALIAEPRNDETLLIAQMQVLFMRFHNAVATVLRRDTSLRGQMLYERARQYVVESYMHIIVNDYLKTMLYPACWEFYFGQTSPDSYPLNWLDKQGNDAHKAIPEVFNGAVFRFGHAMVRRDYFLNKHSGRVTLPELFMCTGKGRLEGHQYLPHHRVIDWSRFFGSQAQGARVIRPSSVITIPHMNWPNNNLSVITLLRGKELGLPDAYTLFDQIASVVGESQRFWFRKIPPSKLLDPGFENFKRIPGLCQILKHPPLWYYTLREVKRFGKRKSLGPLASVVIAETFAMLLKREAANFESYPGDLKTPVDSMQALINFVDQYG